MTSSMKHPVCKYWHWVCDELCNMYLLHIDILFGTGLIELNAHLVCKSSGILRQHNLPIWVIIFVANCTQPKLC